MRPLPLVIGMVAMAAGATLPADPAGAVCSVFDRHPCAPTVCSVFDRHPCAPTVCSVFQRHPCMPEIEYPIGQDLRLTIVSPAPEPPAADSGHDDGSEAGGEHKLDSIANLFAALRGCWVPPPEDEARPGMQMAVRFSFKRNGEIIGTPRVTYTSPDAPQDARDTYRSAVTASLERCTPMPFSKGLGGAIAGRPIAIRYVDNRNRQ
jgi:hypothetical protein